MPINTLNHPDRVTTFRLPEKKGRVISQKNTQTRFTIHSRIECDFLSM